VELLEFNPQAGGFVSSTAVDGAGSVENGPQQTPDMIVLDGDASRDGWLRDLSRAAGFMTAQNSAHIGSECFLSGQGRWGNDRAAHGDWERGRRD